MKLIALFIMLFLLSVSVQAGIVINGTRAIYEGSHRETSLGIKNPDDKPYLVQGWIEGIDGQSKPPFILTPPIFKLLTEQESAPRIIYTGKEGQLPQDRESVFWINIKSVAATPNDLIDKSKLQIAIKSRIKMFYRPLGIIGPAANDAYRKITFAIKNNQLVAINPTPYFVTFNKLSIDGKEIAMPADNAAIKMMLPPFGQQEYPLQTGSAHSVQWKTINDYGSNTKELSQKLNQ